MLINSQKYDAEQAALLPNKALQSDARQARAAELGRSAFTGFAQQQFMGDNLPMTQVSIDDIQRDVSTYLQRVEAGETLVILRAGRPIAEVKPVAPRVETLRPFGLCAGEFMVPDDFDAPLPEGILNAFEGK
jgi:antitoxin (DNA-binding transcriptional repressor) of toxin-antitoxin stability system